MVEGKYKTKICMLFRRGHCPRQSCAFAHGGAELRRFSGSFNDRRNDRGSDLRDRLERRHSPHRRYSPGRDARSRRPIRGYSPARSIERKSDRKYRKAQHSEEQIDLSGSLKISDGTEERVKVGKHTTSDSKDVLEEELKQVQLDIDTLEKRRDQLEIHLEEGDREADGLSSRIKELESQLYKEKEDCKRISSKIKKFVKAHNRCSRVQDDLKRSQARLQKLGAQLGSETGRVGANEEDSSINAASDGETAGNVEVSVLNKPRTNLSPRKKRLRMEATEESKPPADLSRGEGRFGKHSQWNVQNARSNDNIETEAVNNEKSGHRSVVNEAKHKRGKNAFTRIAARDNKPKASESGLVLPATSMAAHADDKVETVEVEVEPTGSRGGQDSKDETTDWPFPLPPPPPLPQNMYSQFGGRDEENEKVDIEGLEEEMVDVDIV